MQRQVLQHPADVHVFFHEGTVFSVHFKSLFKLVFPSRCSLTAEQRQRMHERVKQIATTVLKEVTDGFKGCDPSTPVH